MKRSSRNPAPCSSWFFSTGACQYTGIQGKTTECLSGLSHLGRKGAVPQTANEQNRKAGVEIFTVLRHHVLGTFQSLVLADSHQLHTQPAKSCVRDLNKVVERNIYQTAIEIILLACFFFNLKCQSFEIQNQFQVVLRVSQGKDASNTYHLPGYPARKHVD